MHILSVKSLGIKNQQNLDDKINICKHSLAGISYAFLQKDSWNQIANVLKSWEI